MSGPGRRSRGLRWLAGGTALSVATGCAGRNVVVPGHLPPPAAVADAQASAALAAPGPARSAAELAPPPRPAAAETGSEPLLGPRPSPAERTPDAEGSKAPPAPRKDAFRVPPELPGADAPPVLPPVLPKDASAAERTRRFREIYPELPPLPAGPPAPTDTPALGLAEFQRIGMDTSPVIRRARAAVAAAQGQVVQAGLYPNPTFGYEADQWQPGRDMTKHNNGQQGGFLNQLLKFPGKLTLARAVAGYDYVNAQVAVRRAEVDVLTAVRTAYFAAVVAEQGMAINRALAGAADEVYRLQIKQVSGGEAAVYEPLQLYAQAVQARSALAQAEATYRAAWRQVAAAVGRPDLPPGRLAGRADVAAPAFDREAAQAVMLDRHTDVLTAQNAVLQAQVNLKLQRLTPYPDLSTNTVAQYDNAAKNPQFNLLLGVPLPIYDYNQGNVRRAEAQIARAAEDLRATENELVGRLAEAFGRYEANRVVADNYRERVVPNLTRAYKAIVNRYQGEPGKVSFNDVVVAQQNLVQALQGYLTALSAQWQAVVDVANLTQQDDLYGPPPVLPAGPVPAPPAKP